MFPQVGAALILTGFCYGRSHAFRFVGVILTAYYLALAFFFFWPSQGPYYLCAAHFSEFPSSLQTFSLQKRQLLQASSLWAGKGIESVGLDYYVAFPSLHIAMPLVVAWFLRRWKRILPLLLALDLLLVASIVLLEWHYVVDLVGGVAVAALAILVVGAPHQQPRLAGGFPGAGSD